MVLDELRARLERLLATQSSRRSGLHEALVELKVAAGQSREALALAERELTSQQQQLSDAERRGRLAVDIGDAETGRIAGEFAVKHQQRIELLTRKIGVIRDELAFVEREYESVAREYRSGGEPKPPPVPDLEDDRELRDLERQASREAIEKAVKAQLELLKRKLGR